MLQNNKSVFILISFLILILVIMAGGAITYQRYDILLLVISPFLLFIVLRSNVIPIIMIISLPPFTAWMVEYKILPSQLMWSIELLVAFLLLKCILHKIIKKEKVNLFGTKIVFAFVLIVFISYILNIADTSIISTLLFFRFLFRFYLLFIAVINMDLNERSMKLILSSLVIVFIIQLPLSVVKLFVYGLSENPLGLNGHSMTTSITLIAEAFLFAYYFLYKKSIFYIFLMLGFLGFSIIGAKRAVIFFLPIVVFYLIFFLKYEVRNIFKYVSFIVVILFIFAYLTFRITPAFNPQKTVWGSFDFKYAINWAILYSTASDPNRELTDRRVPTNIRIFNYIHKSGLLSSLFGFGPGTIIASAFDNFDRKDVLKTRFNVEYGVTDFTWLILQVGYLGAILYFLLLYLMLRKSIYYFKIEENPYWKSFGLGMIGFSFIVLLIALFYVQILDDDIIPAFYFCLAGILMKRIEIPRVRADIRL